MQLSLPIYRWPLVWAAICQFMGSGMLGPAVADTGIFAYEYCRVSIVYWIFAGIFVVVRHHPSKIERVIFGCGPMLVFWILIFLR
jgi:hypothetical protein